MQALKVQNMALLHLPMLRCCLATCYHSDLLMSACPSVYFAGQALALRRLHHVLHAFAACSTTGSEERAALVVLELLVPHISIAIVFSTLPPIPHL